MIATTPSLRNGGSRRRSIQLATLRYAVVVGEERSLLRASRRLSIHHSALSRRMRDLEYALGITLFRRHPSGTWPTPAGASFLCNLRRVLTDLDAVLVVEGAAGGETRDPSMDFDACPHADELVDAFADFIHNRPDVVVRFLETRRAELARLL